MIQVLLCFVCFGEEDQFFELCLKFKVVWGYDDVFMVDVVLYLWVIFDVICEGCVIVVESEEGEIFGVCQIELGSY